MQLWSMQRCTISRLARDGMQRGFMAAPTGDVVGVERGGCTHDHAGPLSYDHRPSHPSNAGTEHVGFSPTRQALLVPSAGRHGVFGEPHQG